MRVVLFFVAVLLAAGNVLGGDFFRDADRIDKNLRSHPSFKEILKLYRETNRDLNSGKLTSKTRACNSNGVEMEAILWTDSKGIFRKYQKSGGTGDSADHNEYFYDRKGINRFSYQRAGAAGRGVFEARYYFDKDNNRLHVESRFEIDPRLDAELRKLATPPEGHFDKSMKSPFQDFESLCLEK